MKRIKDEQKMAKFFKLSFIGQIVKNLKNLLKELKAWF